MQQKIILVTGGAGYIGSHTCVALAQAGYRPLLFDNFSNSDPSVIERLTQLIGPSLLVLRGDIRDLATLKEIFQTYPCYAVIHLAGVKAVGESVAKPLDYYDINVTGSLVLLKAMKQAGVSRLVFSSSAAVYGEKTIPPFQEQALLDPINPYGRSKLMIEKIINDLYHANTLQSVLSLRYFNPIGAHPSGFIGETPTGTPNNLLPYLMQVAAGIRKKLFIFGNDYPTADGTAVRDYIHVMDLAQGHVLALQKTEQREGCWTFNLGRGRGSSVLEVIDAFEQASGQNIPYEVIQRRPGDVAASWADPTAAQQQLGWSATYNLEMMCAHSWHWQCHLDSLKVQRK